jgi:hypothetical protein
MVPRIASRGHSFKGAGQYYLHDKQAKTKERVAWTYIHNIPTQDPEKAMGWMAHTAMNADRLKQKAGIATTGRKPKAGPVYSFSLAWHPEQNPDQETMLEAAFKTLELLKLEDHEAVMVAHEDTDHPHVHVICNLVNPENGKTSVQSYDKLILSAWAEEYENNEGQIRCEQRVINNAKRRNQLTLTQKFGMVKHRDKKLELSDKIQKLYDGSDGAKAFQGALEQEGYTLAKGDRRGFVIVDRAGEIFSLSRQLKGQRAKDIKQQLKEIKDLPHAKIIANERKYFDRDKYETERQMQIVDAAIEEDQKKPRKPKTKPKKKLQPKYDDEHLKKLDALREWEQKTSRLKQELSQKLEKQYQRKELLNEIQDLEAQLSSKESMLSKLTGIRKESIERLEALKMNLSNIDQRISEQHSAFDKQAQESHPDNLDEKKRKREDYIRRLDKERIQSNDRGNTPDLEP